ncbi:MAG: hypothetical protein K1000chlam2_01183, partial [Chlamydiae bacterium]|nr:hypothetical protein [Chlamydiota bacterium]
PLVRQRERKNAVFWSPEKGWANPHEFENFDAVIHLAGKNISSGRWTNKLKDEIFKSRCRDTWFLSQVLMRLKQPPKTLICASAVGIYGEGFLAEVCQKWEEATRGIDRQKTRVLHPRFGVVLSPKGGMLKKLLPLFRLGLGAIIGSGEQYMSWVALDDVVGAISYALTTPSLEGSFNLTAPHPETNASFSKKLAKALHRPLFLRIPEKPLRFALGEMADEMLLDSTKALPEKLEKSGYNFRYPTLEEFMQRSF